MQQPFDLFFVSSNENKYNEAKKILGMLGINLGFFKTELKEIQSDSIKEIATKKVIDAFRKCKKPVIIEDDGLVIESLGGFPGPYSSFVFKTIGNKGILKLISKSRKAKFSSVIAFCDSENNPVLFEATLSGKISQKPKGKGWGYDPIFIPNNMTRTFAELKNKNKISHRFKALKKFSKWFLNIQKSND